MAPEIPKPKFSQKDLIPACRSQANDPPTGLETIELATLLRDLFGVLALGAWYLKHIAVSPNKTLISKQNPV